MIELLLIAALGAVGALARHHLGAYVHSSANRALASGDEFPFGTLFVNSLGSFVLGVASALFSAGMIPSIAHVAIGVGLCGSITTFSTLAVDLQRLLRHRRFAAFALLLATSASTGLGAAWLGLMSIQFVR